MTFLCGRILRWDEKASCSRSSRFQRSATSSADASSLVADYVAFDKRRTSRRQYQKAFGGMAIIVLLGALFGRVAMAEAAIVVALLMLRRCWRSR